MEMLYKQHISYSGLFYSAVFIFPPWEQCAICEHQPRVGHERAGAERQSSSMCRSLELFHDFLYDRTRGHSNFSLVYTSHKRLYLNVSHVCASVRARNIRETREFSTRSFHCTFHLNNCTERDIKQARINIRANNRIMIFKTKNVRNINVTRKSEKSKIN